MRQVLHLRGSPSSQEAPKAKALQLMRRKQILDIIGDRREMEGDPAIGSAIEERMIQEELDELERLAREADAP